MIHSTEVGPVPSFKLYLKWRRKETTRRSQLVMLWINHIERSLMKDVWLAIQPKSIWKKTAKKVTKKLESVVCLRISVSICIRLHMMFIYVYVEK